MKRSIPHALLFLAITACAPLFESEAAREREDIWNEAQLAMWDGDFEGAIERFEHLHETFPDTPVGRESLFFLGAIGLDPRNDDWNPETAEEYLTQYLSLMGEDKPRLYRYAEARTLHEIARQLNLPPEDRVEGLQPGERVVTVEERVVVPGAESRELTEEVERLRQELAAREERIRQQEEELERIRRTLTTPSRQ